MVKVMRNRFWLVVLLVAGLGVSASAQARHRSRAASARVQLTQEKIAAAKTYGVTSAPIRIDEFSDFECPHCRELYLETLRPLIDDYVANGKVYIVHHDFPLPMHQYSRVAAYYVDAAAVIGRFERVEQAVFLHQAEWATTGKVEPFVAAVLSPAEWKRVQELAQTEEIKAAVQHDVTLGQQLNVNETPTMYITHKGQRTPIVGDVSYPILRRYLDALLRQ
jgi:protein-disulfide isomerase